MRQRDPRYPAIIRAFSRTPWALLPEKLAEVRDFLRFKADGGVLTDDEIMAIVGARPARPVPSGRGVAILQLFGVISQRAGMLADASGGTSTEQAAAVLDRMVADPSISTIVLQVDSPGGSVFGIQELGDKIHQAQATKRVTAVVDSMAASAAYWLASQAEDLVITPGGMVGSIGVYLEHIDLSQAMEAEGVKATLISAGKYKVEGNPFVPLSDEARDAFQSEVDKYYDAFVAAVARGRGVQKAKVRSGFGEGRMVLARDAVAEGMADRVATMEQVLAKLGVPTHGQQSANASTDTLKKKIALELLDI